MPTIRQLNQTANRNAGKVFLIGIAGVAAYNWRLWQRDKALTWRLRDQRRPVPELTRAPKVSALVAAGNEDWT